MTEGQAIEEMQRAAFRGDVLRGLSNAQKTLPSRWLYDVRGSELFEEITKLDEYYPTRTETAILEANAEAIAEHCGRRALLLEYGAGSGLKTEILLHALVEPQVYAPVDISGAFLMESAERVRARFPGLDVVPIVADFTKEFALPDDLANGLRRSAFFPGSTIGNLDRTARSALLRQMRRHVGGNGAAVIGIDLRKDLEILLKAYDDSEGVTAEFNINLLRRINRELGGNFNLAGFRHRAVWNEQEAAIEMHLESLAKQAVSVGAERFGFAEGETIHTESSRKYEIDEFLEVAAKCGWAPGHVWTDDRALFGVVGLEAAV